MPANDPGLSLHASGESKPLILDFFERIGLKSPRTKQHMRVSVIIPNYNHERFLQQRISSILSQTYKNLDILILDDASTDKSLEVIRDFCARYPEKIRFIANTTNSGGVFNQWKRGIDATEGDLIWICESDDFCDKNFLLRLVPAFEDRSVNLAFGRIQFANLDGSLRKGLDDYREGAEPGIWKSKLVRPAFSWFRGAFGVNNVIANVGGSVWRRKFISDDIWNTAKTYTVLGDWYLYSVVADGGQIVFEPKAVSFFRMHGDNTSYRSYISPKFYEEHDRFMKHIARRWGLESSNLARFFDKLETHYSYFECPRILGALEQFIRKDDLLKISRDEHHVLIVFLGFYVGGGEFVPIHLANELFKRGIMVSMLATHTDNPDSMMLDMLQTGIPVYTKQQMLDTGTAEFLRQTGVTIIHSHVLYGELAFLESTDAPLKVPYVVSLHGSYEAIGVDTQTLAALSKLVTLWVYTAEKNLKPFDGLVLPDRQFTKFGNGLPFDARPFPQSRADLGVSHHAVVFTLVARGVPGKGWEETLRAFTRLQELEPQREVHLLLCGEGEETERVRQLFPNCRDVTYVGFQSCITGLYALSDCSLLSSTYSGESYPLCVIQSLQAGTPVIATDIGEVKTMISTADGTAGIVLPYSDVFSVRVEQIAAAMRLMLDPTARSRFAGLTVHARDRFSMADITDKYLELYDSLHRDFHMRESANTQ